MTCLFQVTVLAVVPPIALDMLLWAEDGDRSAFASVHTISCGAAPLSADLERQLKRNTGAVRVQQGKTSPCRCTVNCYLETNNRGAYCKKKVRGICCNNTFIL